MTPAFSPFQPDLDILEKVLMEFPEQMIKFKAYRRGHIKKKTNVLGYRLTRVSDQRKLPHRVWANIVVESILLLGTLLHEFYGKGGSRQCTE